MLRATLLPAFALLFILAPVQSFAQNSNSEYIPDGAIAAAFLSPKQLLTSPEWELMPTEVIQAAGLEYVGVDPFHIEKLMAVTGFPGPAGPQFGIVCKFTQDYAIENFNQDLVAELERTEVNGRTVYQLNDGFIISFHQPDPRTLMITGGGYLEAMLAAGSAGKGQLAETVARVNLSKGLNVIAVVEPVRPMVTGMLRGQASELPPPLRGLTDIAELTDALLINANFGMMFDSEMSVSALAVDEDAAIRLEQELNNALTFGLEMITAEVKSNIEQDESQVSRALAAYIERFGTRFTEMIRPKRNGKLVRVAFDSDNGNVATIGVMVGLLLPAVQSAREAARRMTASNGLKMIGLAMHNHHSTYKELPDRAIRDESGKPLLSWRVKLLPFLEEQALYEEFHLDEPWDSPHNIQLLEKMPNVFVDPSVPLPPGQTVFQIPLGDGYLFQDEGATKFRQVTDGLSNTIMVVESDASAAVPWTKPDDLAIDPADPISNMGHAHPGGFHVLMGDGAVLFFTHSIDVNMFKAMLTGTGAEVINPRNF